MKEQECAAVGVKLVEEHRLAEVLDVYLRLAPAVSAADRTARATVPCVPQARFFSLCQDEEVCNDVYNFGWQHIEGGV